MSTGLKIIYCDMHNYRWCCAVETLRAELAWAKEQARVSDAAAKKAAADLKVEQATQRQCQERISTMEQELKDATSR